MLSAWWNSLLDLIYPPKCPSCRGTVAHHGQWCDNCRKRIAAPRTISLRAHHLHSVDSCQILYEYEGPLKRIIHDIKFRRASRYARHLAWLLEQAGCEIQPASVDVVVPVPLHAERLTERGYNQTELIYREWAQKRGLPWEDAMVRVKNTVPQWELALADRRVNLRNAFRVSRPGAVAGKRVLLVDDIFTSGLTMDACARELKKAGAKQVHCLALASGAK
jgi:ComF family protein